MKFNNIMLAMLMAIAMPAVAMAQMDHSNMSMSKTEVKQEHVCPMHPHIKGENGTNCPICGMKLVPAKTEAIPPAGGNISVKELAGSTKVDSSLTQAIGVKTAQIKQEEFGSDTRAYGRVVPSTRIENTVTLRAEGWVENLATSALGDPVKKGQRLFNLNSPQLISAQQDYITAKKLKNNDIAKSAANRLRQLGVSKKAMELIKKQTQPLTAVPFYAPAGGVITTLNVRAGDYIKLGMPLMTIQDLSIIWVQADVPERDLSNLKIGDNATIILPEIGQKRLGKITYIQPVVNPATRTGEVRIELENPKGELKPDSFVDVIFASQKRYRLAVPVQAVLRSSMGSYVLRWLGNGRFKPIMIKTGVKSGEFIEVVEGLKQGQEIVTSGQFLLDAEANLKSGMSSMAGHGDMDMGAEEMPQTPAKQEINPHAGH